MKLQTSLYLDLMRFLAAMTVFVAHLEVHASERFSAFWRTQVQFYSQTAITIFFVLSGYVIAHVLATRERTPLEYAASRFGRLYSVALPALVLTAVCNFLLALRLPHLYNNLYLHGNWMAPVHYLWTASFLSGFWLWPKLEPPNAGLFWSLSFEVAYYIAIALIVFANGRLRFLSLVLLGVIAGPTVMLMAPTWALGYAAYHFRRHKQFTTGSAVGVWLLLSILLLLTPLIEQHFRQRLSFLTLPDHVVGAVLAAYAASLCFAGSLVAFNALPAKVERLFKPFTPLIRWLGSITFALYLFHYPLQTLFAVYSVGPRGSALPIIWLITGPLIVVAILGHLCERSKAAYKRFFLFTWSRLGGLRLLRPQPLRFR